MCGGEESGGRGACEGASWGRRRRVTRGTGWEGKMMGQGREEQGRGGNKGKIRRKGKEMREKREQEW